MTEYSEAVRNHTFIYDNEEVELTGRMAKKQIFHKRDVNRVIGFENVVEIAPIGMLSSDKRTHKWVNPRHLSHVTHNTNIDVEELADENEQTESRIGSSLR